MSASRKKDSRADQDRSAVLRKIPKTDRLLDRIPEEVPKSIALAACRDVQDEVRRTILGCDQGVEQLHELVEFENMVQRVLSEIERRMSRSLIPLINATGVVVHTNLGRSLLPEEALDAMIQVSVRYSNLEYDLVQGRRGSRYSHVEQLLCELTGAEAALVVNNNAAAVLLTLETLAKGRQVVVSRGELVEIGGSFRIPDVMARSGAILKEVGATNRTHLRDYAAAIGPETALLMKVHQSNFAVVGFTSSVTVAELKGLAMEHGLAVFEDLGSGNLVDLTRYGFMYEPTVQEAVAAGADVVSFSGDKMLGGPQAGIIVGRKELVDQIKKNPMNRAVRIDKLTLAALESVLRIYRDPVKAVRQIPTLRMLTAGYDEIRARAVRLKRRLARLRLAGLEVGLTDTISRVGGGALPLQELRSVAVTLATKEDPARISSLEARFREASPPLIVRMENERILMDCRTVQERDMAEIPKIVAWACNQMGLGAGSRQDRHK